MGGRGVMPVTAVPKGEELYVQNEVEREKDEVLKISGTIIVSSYFRSYY